MFARVVTVVMDPDKLDAALRVAREQLPDARQHPGFSGFSLLADRETGRFMTISLWETREHLHAMEDWAARARGSATAELGIAPPPAEVYEVVMRS
jgi:heme-degrading monooxygenase HmoA